MSWIRTEESGVPVEHLFEEMRALGCTCGLNLLHKYLDQGRHESDRIMSSPRRLTSWIASRPGNLSDRRRKHLGELIAA
ncbi:hypothetical protein [Streptomyces atratus]|uniref:hypothetical protein n=1 Tax=Streptomyces atratus TaxID=1893 RepID=UPI003787E2AA